MSFSEILNKLMKDNGTSNVSLGKAIGVSDMAVLRWRKGESSPSFDSAVKIADFYGINLDQLAGKQRISEVNNMFALPIMGTILHDLICYGLPSNHIAYATSKDIDGYPQRECYVIAGNNILYYVHQQKMCDSGDIIIYKKTDFVSEYGIPFNVYSMRRYVRKEDYIELEPIFPNCEKIIYRKQEINYLRVVGVVVSQGETSSDVRDFQY